MAKIIGLSRKLKLPWLKYTVDLVESGIPEAEIKEKLMIISDMKLEAQRFCVRPGKF